MSIDLYFIHILYTYVQTYTCIHTCIYIYVLHTHKTVNYKRKDTDSFIHSRAVKKTRCEDSQKKSFEY